MGFIYLLKLYPNNPDNIYKFGKTGRAFEKRFQEYINEGCLPEIIYVHKCDNYDEVEKNILKIFTEKFNKRKTIGNEYFSGDVNEMLYILSNYFINNNNCINNVEMFVDYIKEIFMTLPDEISETIMNGKVIMVTQI